jgi:hypothetical protein
VSHEPELDSVERLLLSLIFHCSKDGDHARAMKDVESAFKSVCEADFELPKISTTACLTLIWQFGDRHYQEKRWSEAADWFVIGSHQIFRSSSPTTSSKCFRKAALCYIEQREYAQASALIRRCSTNEATTHYVTFLTAVHQGLDDEAIRAIQEMLKAADFDRKMLLLATQISHESEMKTVLMSVLEALLKTLKIENNGEPVVEAMTILRCIIRLGLKVLVEPGANRYGLSYFQECLIVSITFLSRPILIDSVIRHFHTGEFRT